MTLIDEARKLLEAATPGPWEARPYDCDGTVSWYVYPPGSAHPIGDLPDESREEADARLIAFLRNNAARLCDALEAAERERDQARAEVERLREELIVAVDVLGTAYAAASKMQASYARREVRDRIGQAIDRAHDALRGTTEGGQGG